jgi:ribosomal protein L6P/L9E
MKISRLAKKDIRVPAGISFSCIDNGFVFTNGKVEKFIPSVKGLDIKIDNGNCKIILNHNDISNAAIGTLAANIRQVMLNFENKHKATAVLIGVGYKAFMAKDGFMVMSLGYSHLVAIAIPTDVEVVIRDNTKIDVCGFTQSVSGFVDDLCSLKPWDACAQKGIVIDGQWLRKKESKKK